MFCFQIIGKPLNGADATATDKTAVFFKTDGVSDQVFIYSRRIPPMGRISV